MKGYLRKGKIHFMLKEYHKCLDDYEEALAVQADCQVRAMLCTRAPRAAHPLARQPQEAQQMLRECNMAVMRREQAEARGEVDEVARQRAQADPEIQVSAAVTRWPRKRSPLDFTLAQALYQSPEVRSALQSLSTDPKAAQEYVRSARYWMSLTIVPRLLSDPVMAKKIQKLRFAGMIRMG